MKFDEFKKFEQSKIANIKDVKGGAIYTGPRGDNGWTKDSWSPGDMDNDRVGPID